MASKNYVEENRGYITASKLKMFSKCPLLFKLLYLDEIEIPEENEERYYVLWTAFHYLMEKWEEKFLEKYHIADSYLVADFKRMLLERKQDLSEEEREKEKKRLGKLQIPQLRAERYGKKREEESQKIRLTPKEWEDLLGMYAEAKQQPIRDMGGRYDYEKRMKFQYQDLRLSFKPDRIMFYIWEDMELGDLITDDKRMSLQALENLMRGKTREEMKEIVATRKIKWVIRDFKTTQNITKFRKDLFYNDNERLSYVMSMSFYYTAIYVKYGIECDVVLDVIEKTAPYTTQAMEIPRDTLRKNLRNKIVPALDEMLKCREKDERPIKLSREEFIDDPFLKKYLPYIKDLKQTHIDFLDFDMI